MSETGVVVNCPHCGFPYPMTAMQREVYRGRNMGCMNCGRPFAVDQAPMREAAQDLSAHAPANKPGNETPSDGTAGGVLENRPATNEPAALESPATTVASASSASVGQTPRTSAPSNASSAPAARPKVRPNTSAVVGAVSGIVLFVQLALTLITTYIIRHAPDTDGSDTIGVAEKVTITVLLSLVMLAAILSITGGVLGLLATRRPLWAGEVSAPRDYVAGRPLAIAALAMGIAGLLAALCILVVMLPVLRGGGN